MAYNNTTDSNNIEPDQDETEKIKERTKRENEITAKVKKYKDIEGLSTQKLNFGLWYVEHRRLFIRIFMACLAVASAILWIYSIYGFGYYLAVGMRQDELLAWGLVQTNTVGHDYIVQIGPKEMQYSSVDIIASAGGKYDLVASIRNNNQRWFAGFTYYFLANGEQTEKKYGFALPGDDKYLAALAQEFKIRPTGARLIIENLGWQRINRHEISNWQEYKDSRLKDINIEDVDFIPASTNLSANKINLNEVNFSAVNNTPYSYWQMNFIIVLFRGQNIISVNEYTLDEFISGQTRPISVRWPGQIGGGKVEVIPELNILQDDIYIIPTSEPSEKY